VLSLNSSVRNSLAGILILSFALLTVATVTSCSSESAETQTLYTDAKSMWDELHRAFMLPKGDERTQEMYKFINEGWDTKIVDKLELYLTQAPDGKYAKEAKSLLEEAQKSQELRGLGQMRALSGQLGLPQNQSQVDSAAAKAQEIQESVQDTTKSGN